MTDLSDRATLAAFALLVVVAGGNAVAIRSISCESCELDPFSGAAMRFLLASLIFGAVVVMRRLPVPSGRALLGSLLYGALQFGAGFGLVYWGLVRAPAGLSQVLLASVPLLTFALALVQRQERFRWDALVGAAFAFAGMAVVFNGGANAGIPWTSMGAILLGAVCWAQAFVVVKAFPPVHPAAMNAVAMATGTAILLALAVATGESFVAPSRGITWAAQFYLVVAGSVGVFWLYVVVLRRWTASAASYQLVLIPLVTVALSAWLQDEPITVGFAGGALLVLGGVYFGALRGTTLRHDRTERSVGS